MEIMAPRKPLAHVPCRHWLYFTMQQVCRQMHESLEVLALSN